MLVANDGDDHDNSDGNNVYFQNHYNDNDVCLSSTATIINKQFSFKFYNLFCCDYKTSF